MSDGNWIYIDHIFSLEENSDEEKTDGITPNQNQKISVCPECLFSHPSTPTDLELVEIADEWRYAKKKKKQFSVFFLPALSYIYLPIHLLHIVSLLKKA